MRYFIRYGMVYIESEDKAYRVKYNPANQVYFVLHVKSGKEWQLSASEFIYNSAGFNTIVDRFPGYIHSAVWFINNIKYTMEEKALQIRSIELSNLV